MTDKEAFYKKLKESLENTTQFPAPYLYKFIVPANGNQLQEIKEVYKSKPSKITTNTSKTGKYISVSITVQLSSSDEVISFYKKVEKIEGIISL